jgi:predicted dehydrogenase
MSEAATQPPENGTDGADPQGWNMAPQAPARPQIGFLGLGWIGRHRMQAVLDSGHVDVAALADPSPEMLEEASDTAPEAALAASFDELLALDLDGIVIATPSALHAEQATRALEHGLAVFCQKPLGRTGCEVRQVIEAARKADRLLGVDMSYRFTHGMRLARELIQGGEIGRVFAADLVFHNAYGPDKAWFYDYAQSGGGCVMDLGVHLIDLALWSLGEPAVAQVHADLYAGGEHLAPDTHHVEDFAAASIRLETGTLLRLACSWRLNAGRDAVIEMAFHGTDGGLSFHNVDGSFYDFALDRLNGTSVERLVEPPDAWGGRAAAAWAEALAGGARFDPAIEDLIVVGDVLDRIYGRG